jgi:hypothetical protein
MKLGPIGSGETKLSFDARFPENGPALYRYFLRAEFKSARPNSGSGLDAIAIRNDLQMSAFAIPSLQVGDNDVVYADESKDPGLARITFRWVERSGPPLAEAPAAAVSPADAAEVEGTRVRFRWQPVQAPEATRIDDYHFQLGDRPDLLWVLSPNFDKLMSLTNGGDVAGASYVLPDVGLLNPGQRYYWRVRARDDRGAWGPWSRIWSFTPQTPGVPGNLRVTRDGREFTLQWDPAPAGRKPVRYVVYASNERGFTASDAAHPVWAGNQKSGGLFPGQEFVTFPANRLSEVREPRLRLRPSHAYYRVRAVDEKGEWSGVSDLLAAPRPFLFTDPPAAARPGAPYRYEAKSIASIGHVRSRTIGDDLYAAAFWDAERPRFKLVSGPTWLTVDPKTGVLSGTVPADLQGPVEVSVEAKTEGVGSDRQTFTIRP